MKQLGAVGKKISMYLIFESKGYRIYVVNFWEKNVANSSYNDFLMYLC